MNQAIQTESFQSDRCNKTSPIKCTCEIGNLKALCKNSLRYSMCDVCSEKLFSQNGAYLHST